VLASTLTQEDQDQTGLKNPNLLGPLILIPVIYGLIIHYAQAILYLRAVIVDGVFGSGMVALGTLIELNRITEHCFQQDACVPTQ
jgi:hypothetical protein